jgi:hypothetical protein
MRIALSILLSLIPVISCAAEGGLKATVTESASIEVPATALDVVLTLKQKGPDAKAASEALKVARDAAVVKLVALGANAQQVRDETPAVVEKGGNNSMQKAMAQMRAGGDRLKRNPKKGDEPPEIQLKQVVHVPMPLTGKDAQALMLEAEKLKAAVRAAKVLPEAEDEEESDENRNAYAAMMTGEKKMTGPLEFQFSAERTADLEQRVYAEAVKSAREKANRLAAAAGFKNVEASAITLQEGEGANGDAMSQYVRIIRGAMKGATPSATLLNGDTPMLSVQATVVLEAVLR